MIEITDPSVEVFGALPTARPEAIRFIERCGRLCYKSEDNITPTSGDKFVGKLIKAGHLAMVEHSNFVVVNEDQGVFDLHELRSELGQFLKVHPTNGKLYVGGNLTAWYQSYERMPKLIEGSGLEQVFAPFDDTYGDLFQSWAPTSRGTWQVCPDEQIPTELHRYSVKFVCDRGVSHELVRHRTCSFCQESTRYVNYGGRALQCISPWWAQNDKPGRLLAFSRACQKAAKAYNRLLELGAPPQDARAVLPNALKTEIIVTADSPAWAHIRKLRSAPSAHPDMRRLMDMVNWELLGQN